VLRYISETRIPWYYTRFIERLIGSGIETYSLSRAPHSISNFRRWASKATRLSRGLTRATSNNDDAFVTFSVFISVLSSLSVSVVPSGIEYPLSVLSVFFAHFVSWRTGLSFSPERISGRISDTKRPMRHKETDRRALNALSWRTRNDRSGLSPCLRHHVVISRRHYDYERRNRGII